MKKLFLFLFVIILLSSFTYASLTTNLQLYLNGTVVNDSSPNHYTFTNSGISIVNNRYQCINAQSDRAITGNINLGFGESNLSICYFINATATQTSYSTTMDFTLGTTNWIIQQNNLNHRAFYFTAYDGGSYLGTGKTTIVNASTDNFFCIIKSGANVVHYLNGVSNGSVIENAVMPTSNTPFTLCSQGTARYFDGQLWNIAVYNRNITESEMLQLYNNGVGCNPINNPSGCSGVSASLVINTNLVNNTKNYNLPNIPIYYNGTLTNTTTNLYNCTLYENGIVNLTSNDVNMTKNNLFNFTYGEVEKNFYFSLSCNNFEANYTTGVYNYSIDTINPFIDSTFINNSEFNQGELVKFKGNCTDSNLFAYNVTWFDASNTVLQNSFQENLTVTTIEVNSQLSASNLGNYSIRFECWDSHTINIIPDYQWEKIQYVNNNVTYKGISIRNIELVTDDFSYINDFYLIKKTDRFLFAFDFNTFNTPITIYLKADNVKYLPNSKYKGHFIINNKHWVDFESDDIINLQIKYLENYGYYQIKFTPIKSLVVFKSIGDLNYQSLTYYYNVVYPLSLTETNNILNNIYGVIALIGWFILFGILFIVGFWQRFYLFVSLSAVPLLLGWLQFTETADFTLKYVQGVSIVLFIMALVLLASGGYLMFFKKEEPQENQDVYTRIRQRYKK